MVNNNLLDEMAKILKKSNKQTVKQKKIIEVAITLFAEKGYSNTATSEIAKMAGVAEGTIFKHYGTKENLLLSIMVPFIKDFFPTMADELIGELMNDKCTFEEFLRAFLTNRIAFISENREIFQVVIKEIIYKEELKNEILPYILEAASVRLVKVIEIFKQRGDIKDIPNDSILKMLGTVMSGFFISNFILLNKKSISEDAIEDIVFFILNGFGQSPQ
ncbi:TetR/AcrR family transcriptional regulator [Pseudobacillus wudalianchiensis]|uniref:TetR family transcriptional regulator n=1 Tax=Pseudobacillus wudalianchiensis TaxID=1743143 RepID=A0A1B9AN49_9BACI|nr:TetR/AcrR family transcriptional regulator [Bacillus wudalianchiensis]OCA85068.1 TetR family transcriptional regulator [Bacillus wudalianchiensis]